MSLLSDVYDFIMLLDDYLWYVALVLIVAFGLYATFRLNWLQLRHFPHALHLAIGDIRSHDAHGKISSFEAFCISMGARIGVGNIAGTAAAIMTGGPGAIFWMWVFAVIGAASSFVETVIGQIYKERKSDGECYGGPAYYAQKGFNSRRAGMVVAFIVFLMFAVGFAGIECCNASAAMCNAFQFENNGVVFALLITVIFIPIVLGGAHRVAKASSQIVPVMALGWIVFALIVILINWRNIPQAFAMIFVNAFDVPSVVGGGIGGAIMMGMRRGVLSNEAGIGTVTSVSAVANVKHPVKQGYIQAFGVLVDTFLICTMSALVILTYGNYDSICALGLEDISLVQGVASAAVGSIANAIVALFIFLFAFTCLVSDFLTSETNIRFIRDNKFLIWGFRAFLVCMVFVTCLIATSDMFDILDILMAITGITNIILITKLRKRAFEAKADYDRQREAGVEEPVFTKDVLSDKEGVTEWD